MFFKRLLFFILVSSSLICQDKSLPVGFNSINIGDDMDSVSDKLSGKNDYFEYEKEDVDFSEVPSPIIDTQGKDLVKRGVFQFLDKKLYSIYIEFDSSKMDFYTLRMSLQDKWGYPNSVSPNKVVWENDSIIINLEKPLILKYIDKKKLEDRKKKSEEGLKDRNKKQEDLLKAITG